MYINCYTGSDIGDLNVVYDSSQCAGLVRLQLLILSNQPHMSKLCLTLIGDIVAYVGNISIVGF